MSTYHQRKKTHEGVVIAKRTGGVEIDDSDNGHTLRFGSVHRADDAAEKLGDAGVVYRRDRTNPRIIYIEESSQEKAG